MVLQELDGDVVIHQVTTPEDTSRWRPGFIGAYQTVFSGFPYFERFYPSEADGIWRKLTSLVDSVVLIASRKESVVGFAAAIPLVHKKDVSHQLTGLVPIAHTIYLAELGVLERHRGKHIGRTLVQERLRLIDRRRYSHVVLRVSGQSNPSSEMYRAMEFEDMGVYHDVRTLRTDGRVRTDRRFFMARVLSQVST